MSILAATGWVEYSKFGEWSRAMAQDLSSIKTVQQLRTRCASSIESRGASKRPLAERDGAVGDPERILWSPAENIVEIAVAT